MGGKNGKQEVDEEEKGKTAAKITDKIGVSQTTYERAKRIIEEGTEEQKEALRSVT